MRLISSLPSTNLHAQRTGAIQILDYSNFSRGSKERPVSSSIQQTKESKISQSAFDKEQLLDLIDKASPHEKKYVGLLFDGTVNPSGESPESYTEFLKMLRIKMNEQNLPSKLDQQEVFAPSADSLEGHRLEIEIAEYTQEQLSHFGTLLKELQLKK